MTERRDELEVKENAPPVVGRRQARTTNGDPKDAGLKQGV